MTPTVHEAAVTLALGASRPANEDGHASSGSEGALTDITPIFRQYARFVFRTLRRLGISDADVDDVFQDIFVILHRKLPELDASQSLHAWLYTTCARRAAYHRRWLASRREHMTEEEIEPLPDVVPPSSADQLDARWARAALENILRSLPDQKREVFILHFIEELPMQDVANAVGCRLHTAYSRFYAARKLVEDGIRRARAQVRRP